MTVRAFQFEAGPIQIIEDGDEPNEALLANAKEIELSVAAEAGAYLGQYGLDQTGKPLSAPRSPKKREG